MYNQIAMNVANNAVAAGIVGLANVKSVLPDAQSEMGLIGRDAVAYTLADDLVTWYQTGDSKILNMDYKGLTDNIVYNMAVIGVGLRTGVIENAVEYVESISPLPQSANNAIVDGALITVGQTLKDYMLTNPVIVTTPLKYLVHPTALLTF